MANRVRNIVLRVPVTAQEREMIELKMQQMGTRCFSTYARKMLIDGYVIKIDYSDIKAIAFCGRYRPQNAEKALSTHKYGFAGVRFYFCDINFYYISCWQVLK